MTVVKFIWPGAAPLRNYSMPCAWQAAATNAYEQSNSLLLKTCFRITDRQEVNLSGVTLTISTLELD
jgi:hypothetical protein